MLIFGVLGYFMRKYGFHPAALVLGLILGPMAEKGYRQSLVLSNDSLWQYFFSRPISVMIMLLIILTITAPFIMEWWTHRRKLPPLPPTEVVDQDIS